MFDDLPYHILPLLCDELAETVGTAGKKTAAAVFTEEEKRVLTGRVTGSDLLRSLPVTLLHLDQERQHEHS